MPPLRASIWRQVFQLFNGVDASPSFRRTCARREMDWIFERAIPEDIQDFLGNA